MNRIITLSITALIGTFVILCSAALAQQNPEPGSGFATWDSKKGAWSDGSVSRGSEPAPATDMNTEAGIRAQADRIFGAWVSQSRQHQKEMWIANRMIEQLDRQRGNSLSFRVNR